MRLGRRLLGGLSGLGIGGLIAFHLVLFAGRIADASIAHPEVLAQWLGALLLAAGALALRRRGVALGSGRSALVFWLLVLLLHVGFGSGLTPSGEVTGDAHPLLLLLPLAALSVTAAAASWSGARAGRLRPLSPAPAARAFPYPGWTPRPASFSAGAGPDRFSPRPPPFS
jgi:hypothetical protein